MPIEEIPVDIIVQLGKIGKWIQAIGFVIILWIIFQVIILINNRIRRKRLYTIEQRLDKIEKKIDKLLKIKNKI